ncbi:Transcription activator of gluconeogenesis ERT1 [Labeo rohita]|uniref:Transcription activator of gluconeogenesis ERT1 n=1 Tax=Labeo rohita TaxID=84645 RepID=A0ABQ8LAA5_LABRO|nr:Transcription activator of gluconeogenesis ERT1 [Labeo rohita]
MFLSDTNTALRMDPLTSRLPLHVTEYSANKGSSSFSNGHCTGMDTTKILFRLKQGPRSLEQHISEFLAIVNFSDLPDSFMDFALLCVGLPFTVGIAEEEHDNTVMAAAKFSRPQAAGHSTVLIATPVCKPACKMATAPERAHVMLPSRCHTTSQLCFLIKLHLLYLSLAKSKLLFLSQANSELLFLSQVKLKLLFLTQVKSQLVFTSQVTAVVPVSSQAIAVVHESSKVTAVVPEPSQATADLREPIQVTINLHEPSQVTADLHEPSQVTAGLHEPSQVTAAVPGSSLISAGHPESIHISAGRPESGHVSAGKSSNDLQRSLCCVQCRQTLAVAARRVQCTHGHIFSVT